MNFKRTMLIMLLLAVLTIGAVSAADDVDALAADDTGDEEVIEAPVDDASLEAGENENFLEEDNDVIVINDEISSESDDVCQVKDSSYVYGTISVFANGTHVASKYCGGGYKTEKILAKKMTGSFSGTYNIKIVYHNMNDGANYTNEGLVTFKTPITNKGISPEEFNFTLVHSEVTINDDNAVIFSYQWPEGTSQWDHIGIALNDESDRNFNKNSETSRNITLNDLYIFEQDTFHFTANYYDSDNYMTKITDGTFKVTKVYTANDFIEVYAKTISDPTDYVCNVFDSDAGLVGDVSVLANNTQVYSKKFTDKSKTAQRINGNDLTGDLKGSYNIKVVYKRSADGKEYSKSVTITFGSSEPVNPDTRPWLYFNPSVKDIEYGQNAVVKVTTLNGYNDENKTFSGNVLVQILYFNGIEYVTVDESNVSLKNGAGTATFSNLNASSYMVYLVANDTDAYKAQPYSADFTVSQISSQIEALENIELEYGTSTNITVSAKGATGISAKIDDEAISVNAFVIPISNLTLGQHVLNVTTVVDSNHIAVTQQATITVVKPKSSIVMGKNIFLIKDKSVNVTVTTNNALGFTAEIDGKPVTVDGNVIIVSGLDVGNHTLTVTTIVDDNHVAVTENATITVSEAFSLVVPDVTFDYGTAGACEISEAFTIVNASVNNAKAIVTFAGNDINISGLDAGTYTLTVSAYVIPDDVQVKQAKVTVNKVYSKVDVNNVVMNYGETVNVPVNVTGGTGFTAKIDGNAAVVKDNAVVVSGLEVGNHTLIVIVVPDANHNAAGKNVMVTVNAVEIPKLATSVTASKVTVTYGTTKNIVVTLKDANNVALPNQKVTVTINGKPYNGNTNDKGQASIAVPKTLAVKTYKSTITFAGDDKYEKSTGSVNVVVSKATPKLTAKAKTLKRSDKSKKYTVTLKTNLNKVMKNTKVTIKVNKKTYTAKTNSKGVATFKLTKLTKKGKYTATVKYAGNSNYKAKSVNVKITIK